MPAYLPAILASHRAMATADTRSRTALEAAVAGLAPARGFRRAIATRSLAEGIAVIAEVKRRSPSKGVLDPGLDPAQVAPAYEAGGATCLSVLTDREFFGGSPDDLRVAREACSVPVLRKDFTVTPADVYDARAMGADAVLLIVAALDEPLLRQCLEVAGEIGIDALVEVHSARELDAALSAGATLVGVNQRDLETFEVDQDLARELRGAIPSHVVTVAESGIRDESDVAALRAVGFDAVLVGETFVRSADRAVAVADLVEAGRGRREPVTASSVAVEPGSFDGVRRTP